MGKKAVVTGYDDVIKNNVTQFSKVILDKNTKSITNFHPSF